MPVLLEGVRDWGKRIYVQRSSETKEFEGGASVLSRKSVCKARAKFV